MEVPVCPAETSAGRISVKKSSNSENKDVVAHHSGEKRCNEEREGSENDSKWNEFSLVRKMSFKELRKVEEIEDEPNLAPKRGQVSLVMECKDKLENAQQKEVPTTKREEEKKHPEGNAKDEPAILHLSQIKIQDWTKVKVKKNDEEALCRVKQVCGALEGDSIYHYENIDDFDDTIDNYRRTRCDEFKRSRTHKHINCKYKLHKNNMISIGVTCKGVPTEDDDEDLRSYFLGNISCRAKTIKCFQKHCTNVYDPTEVVEVCGNKAAMVWLEDVAKVPLPEKRVKGILLPLIIHTHTHTKKSSSLEKARESEPKGNWWKRKSRTKKIKLQKTSDDKPGRVVSTTSKADKSATSEVKANHEVLNTKHVCTTCMEELNEDVPEAGGLTCGHYTCRTCLQRYFYGKEQMYHMIPIIECPRLDCQEEFDTSFILRVLDDIPLRNAYLKFYDQGGKELDHHERSKCHQRMEHTESSSGENQGQTTDTELLKSSSFPCPKWGGDNSKRCPGCNTPTVKYVSEGGCNIVRCYCCKTKFCWICGKKCNKAFHMYKCPLYGSKRFGKKRRVANYFGYSAGIAVGVPVIGTLVIGTGAVALATLIAIGSLSPPLLLSRKMHKYHKLHRSSTCRRRLSILGGASLGVLLLPVLSAWGVYRTVITASKKTAKILDHFLPPRRDDEDLFQKLHVASKTYESNEPGRELGCMTEIPLI